MTKLRKVTYILTAFFAVLVFIISSFVCGGLGVAYAATSTNEVVNFDKTNVLDDLNSADDFNVLNYPYDSTGYIKSPEIIGVIEYCYSFDSAKRSDYGLYIYFYNPQVLDIAANSNQNKIMLAISWRINADNSVDATDYEKFDLKFCNMSTGDYYGLFYKFKVIDHKSSDGKTMVERLNSNARRYDISEVELLTTGNLTATAYSVGASYVYSGYAAGMGADTTAESTLSCTAELLETVQLDVKHTYYRSNTSSLGAGYQVQLDTVYFSVPKYYFERYGSLQRIKAEWYEYQTKDIIVTNDWDAYSYAKKYRGKDIGLGNRSAGYGFTTEIMTTAGTSISQAEWIWNGYSVLGSHLSVLYNLLYTTGSVSEYDPYASVTSTGGVLGNDLYDYLLTYDGACSGETLEVKDGVISADLFADDISENRKIDNEYGKIQKGYSCYDFDISTDLQELKTYNPSENSWNNNVKMYGFWNTLFKNYGTVEQSKKLPPIQVLTDKDISGTSESKRRDISNTLCVRYSDVAELQDYYAKSKANDEYVVLFRFATTDYFSQNLKVLKLTYPLGLEAHSYTKGQAYRASESVFFNFDIVQLSFSKNGVLKVIPVVASPIDIVNDLTPPFIPGGDIDWRKIIGLILGLIVIVLILVFLTPIISPAMGFILNGVLTVIKAPFKAIGALFKGIKKAFKKKE